MRALMWFRADLRARDNVALSEACRRADGGVVGVFTICPGQWQEHDWADVKVEFLLRNLRALKERLERLNIPLRVVTRDTFDGVPDAIGELAGELGCDALYFNREYEVNEVRRDGAVMARCAERGMGVHGCTDQVVLPAGSVRTNDDGWYTVFTPFCRKWKAVWRDLGGVAVRETPGRQRELGIEPDEIPESIEGFDLERGRAGLWEAGEEHARRRLESFVADRLAAYHERRDSPAVNGTSTLSPYLALGVVSARQCLEAAREANGGRLDLGKGRSNGATAWINELIWREFYKHLLVAFPKLSMGRAFRAETERIAWRDDDEHFEAWCAGRTGFPIVDAAMRQMIQTGWMHNRCRMIAAMFLTKNLLIDWRRGERFFMRHLVDGDLASNNGGWQWSASTGTDAAPYFRVYNPCSQSARHDPEASYIKRFVAELEGFDAAEIHEPAKMDEEAREEVGYPAMIVDLKETRGRAIEAFKDLKA